MATNATELQLQRTGPDAMQAAPVIDYNREQIELIKDIYAKGATDAELKLFIEIAKRKGLDIFSNQLYLIERYDSNLGKTVKRPQTSIDGFRLIADRTGNYAPGRKTEYTEDENGRVISATAFVQKLVRGQWFEVSGEVWFNEYKQVKKDGNLFPIWAKMPRVMLGKCAEAVTLRRAFPADLSGLYTTDEMGTVEPVPPVETEPAQAAPKNVTPKAAPKPPAKTTPKTPIGTLDSLIREIRGYGIADAEIQSHMKNVTGAEKRADLTAEQIQTCIEAFEPWANELHAKLTETEGES